MIDNLDSIEVLINGSPHRLPAGQSVEETLHHLRLRSRAIAVEINGVLVPSGNLSNRRVQAGDELEIVTLVGGG
ncbi:MAG TPA: sulfur carrier protein ThiS [Pirellulaceae bacterium]|nr:sulfur carrier protein ThiS [Pirellulaceae bacterium]